jgi:hypothetical protein
MEADGKEIGVVLTIGLSRRAFIVLMVVTEVGPDFALLYVGEYAYTVRSDQY